MSTTPRLHQFYVQPLAQVNWDNLTLFDFNEQQVVIQSTNNRNLTAFYPNGQWIAIDEAEQGGYVIVDKEGLASFFRYVSQAVWFGGYLLGLYSPQQT